MSDFLLTEDGFYLLLETGDKILLESSAVVGKTYNDGLYGGMDRQQPVIPSLVYSIDSIRPTAYSIKKT